MKYVILNLALFSAFTSTLTQADTPIFQYKNPHYVYTIANPSRPDSFQFIHGFDDRVFDHYQGNVTLDRVRQDESSAECERMRTNLETIITDAMSTFTEGQGQSKVEARFGTVNQTTPVYGLWSAPYCSLDVGLTGRVQFVIHSNVFKGRSSDSDCSNQAKVESDRKEVIAVSCSNVSGLFRKKFQLDVTTIESGGL